MEKVNACHLSLFTDTTIPYLKKASCWLSCFFFVSLLFFQIELNFPEYLFNVTKSYVSISHQVKV